MQRCAKQKREVMNRRSTKLMQDWGKGNSRSRSTEEAKITHLNMPSKQRKAYLEETYQGEEKGSANLCIHMHIFVMSPPPNI